MAGLGMGFGFAQPMQRRLPIVQPMMQNQAPSVPQLSGQSLGDFAGDIRSGLAKLGLSAPPSSAMGAPQTPPATSVAPTPAENGTMVGAPANTADAAASGGAVLRGIGNFLADLFGG